MKNLYSTLIAIVVVALVGPPMRQFLAALLVALYSTALSSAPLTEAETAAALDAHNAVRQRVAQAESLRLGGTVRIPDLTWDPTVAAVAQEWADFLINQNPPEIHHRSDLGERDLGENLYLAWSTGIPDQSASTAVESWASEQQYYNYDQNTCTSGKVCGHYTQVVWSSTQRLGCGRAVRTTTGINGRTYVIWVCNYEPAGNINGQRPYSVEPGGQAPGGQAEGGHTTRHFIEVHFTKMRVHNCNEGGTCDWRLTCRLGNQQGTLLLDNIEADDRDEPRIDRVLTQEGALPVTVECKVEEHDGGFDPGWEHIGTHSTTILQGGANQIRITHVDDEGDVDEGDVTIHLDALGKLQIGSTGQPPPTASTTQPSDTLLALRATGIDFSVPEADLRQWLNNSFTPYPALAAALLKLLEGKRLRQPVYLDVIAWNYEHAPGASSPRSLADVDLALLRAAVVEGYNERYGKAVTDFQRLVDNVEWLAFLKKIDRET